MASSNQQIRFYELNDIAQLCEIEFDASKRFLDTKYSNTVTSVPKTEQQMLRFLRSSESRGGNTFVIGVDNEKLSGFLTYSKIGNLIYILELSVRPEVGRQGLATKLLAELSSQNNEATYIGLSTFADINFNAPFYKKRGFVTADPIKFGEIVVKQVTDDTPKGASLSERIFMMKEL